MTTELERPPGSAIDLRLLARDMPLVRERALLELVSDMGAAEVQNGARGREGFFSRMWRGLRGKDRAEQVSITGKVLSSQRTMQAWVRELSDQQAISDVALAQMAGHLRELQRAQARTGMVAEQALSDVRELASIVGELAREVDARLQGHDQRLDEHAERIILVERRLLKTELWQAAWAGFDRTVRRWETAGAYRRVAWSYQVALLAREVATGPCGVHEFVTEDRRWRDRLIERILADPQQGAWAGTEALDNLLESAQRASGDPDERAMVAELLGAGLPDDLRPPDGLLSAALTLAMEYAAQDPDVRPERCAAEAVNHVLLHRGYLPTSYTVREYVRRLVNEQGDGAQEALRALRDRSGSTPDE